MVMYCLADSLSGNGEAGVEYVNSIQCKGFLCCGHLVALREREGEKEEMLRYAVNLLRFAMLQ